MSPIPSTMPSLLALLWPLAALPLALAQATWNFTLTSTPTECEPISLTYSGGVAPHTFTFYNLSGTGGNLSDWYHGGLVELSPDGASTGENGIQAGYEIVLPFGENSSIVVVGSDATGFATGGTSIMYSVLPSPSGNNTCGLGFPDINYLTNVRGFTNPPQECGPMGGLFYDVAFPIIIDVVIPGGESFLIDSTPLNSTWANDSTTPGNVYLLAWTMPVPVGTQLFYSISDADGHLGVVSGLQTVELGTTYDCLANGTYSATGAPYAGAVETSPPVTDPSGTTGGPNVGDIVGGVVGGIAGLVLLLAVGAFLMRRYNKKKLRSERQGNIKLLSYAEGRRPGVGGGEGGGWGKREGAGHFFDEEDLGVPERAARRG